MINRKKNHKDTIDPSRPSRLRHGESESDAPIRAKKTCSLTLPYYFDQDVGKRTEFGRFLVGAMFDADFSAVELRIQEGREMTWPVVCIWKPTFAMDSQSARNNKVE